MIRNLATGGSSTDRAILHGALELLVSYSWDAKVELRPLEMTGEDADPRSFVRELRFRHLLAVAAMLPTLVQAIEMRPSTRSVLERSESRGAINGRLDVPRYISRRSQIVSYPRRYPVVRQRTDFGTVENQLVQGCLREVGTALRDNPFGQQRAEESLARTLLAAVRGRLQAKPWNEVAHVADSARLDAEVATRIRRRQTGNDDAYQAFLDWRELWNLDPTSFGRMSSKTKQGVVNGILAFPAGPAFWDKVFEVWCLRIVRDALVQLGWPELERPRPLHGSTGVVFRHAAPGGRAVRVYFQRSTGLTGSWWYESRDSSRRLTGIPDIMVTLEGSEVFPLLVDAKYRMVSTTDGGQFTRSEETYKMLGYAENFAVTDRQFRGVLIFPAEHALRRRLVREDRGRLDLLTVNPEADLTVVIGHMAEALSGWLPEQ